MHGLRNEIGWKLWNRGFLKAKSSILWASTENVLLFMDTQQHYDALLPLYEFLSGGQSGLESVRAFLVISGRGCHSDEDTTAEVKKVEEKYGIPQSRSWLGKLDSPRSAPSHQILHLSSKLVDCRAQHWLI